MAPKKATNPMNTLPITNEGDSSEENTVSEHHEEGADAAVLGQLRVVAETVSTLQKNQQSFMEALLALQKSVLPLTGSVVIGSRMVPTPTIPTAPELPRPAGSETNMGLHGAQPNPSDPQGVTQATSQNPGGPRLPSNQNANGTQVPAVAPGSLSNPPMMRDHLPYAPTVQPAYAPIIEPALTPSSSEPKWTMDLIKEHVRSLVQQERPSSCYIPELDLRPPYPVEIASLPYPQGYVVPKFLRFDGKKGNAREHIQKFVDALGIHGYDINLRLREFSKSLTDKAY